jgi:hypothetical protein
VTGAWGADGDRGSSRFGYRSVDLLTCRNCGVYVAAIMGSGEQPDAVINVRALESPPRSCRYRRLFSFDGKQAAERTHGG